MIARPRINDVVLNAQVGDTLPTFETQVLDSTRVRQFSRALRDPNPVHLNDEFARSVGLDGVIAQGGVSVVALGYLVTRWAGLYAISSLSIAFKSPTYRGQALVCDGVVTSVSDDQVVVQCWARTKDGLEQAEGTICLHRRNTSD